MVNGGELFGRGCVNLSVSFTCLSSFLALHLLTFRLYSTTRITSAKPLARGRDSSVFKGRLPDNQPCAIKFVLMLPSPSLHVVL